MKRKIHDLNTTSAKKCRWNQQVRRRWSNRSRFGGIQLSASFQRMLSNRFAFDERYLFFVVREGYQLLGLIGYTGGQRICFIFSVYYCILKANEENNISNMKRHCQGDFRNNKYSGCWVLKYVLLRCTITYYRGNIDAVRTGNNGNLKE